ncbi:VWA domain-containing protein [candidate division CSSED10-310 bacterium]|uniref:VWA domain-containing protein n=1 Tax=candidate division CSSED10-310 bacterium TaxID=2855610 RepID=A0ABV6YUE6_UNCC1
MNTKIYVLFIISYCFSCIPMAEATQLDSRLQKNLYIVFDGSGSMTNSKCSGKQRKIDVAKDALVTFLKTIPEDYNCGLFVFDKQGSREIYPFSSIDRQQLISIIQSIKAGGSTPLGNAIDQAKQAIVQQKQKQLGYGEFILLIVTDGEADNKRKLPAHVKPVTDEGIVIQVIGFCLGQTHSLKQNVHKYREANSPQELETALQDVLGEAETFTDLSEFEYLSLDEPLESDAIPDEQTAPARDKKPAVMTNLVYVIVLVFLIIFISRAMKKKK